MKKNYFVSLAFIATLTGPNYSCSSDNVLSVSEVDKKTSELSFECERALDVLRKFDNEVNSSTKADNGTFNVKSFFKNTVNLTDATTKAMIDSIDNPLIDIYTIEFERNGKEGYSILTSDDRLSKVYAYTEYGSFADTITNKVLAEVIQSIPLICKEDLIEYYTTSLSTKSGSLIDVLPFGRGGFITAAFDNTWPNNKYFDKVVGTTDRPQFNGYYTGNCVQVGMALFFTYHTGQGMHRPNLQDDLCKIFRWVAYESDLGVKHITYNGDSPYRLSTARRYLDSAGFKYVYKKASEIKNDEEELYDSMFRNSQPVIAYYGTTPTCWIMSGVKGTHNPDTYTLHRINEIYCNWCDNGKSNGWYTNWRRKNGSSFDRKIHEIIYFKWS